MSPNASHRVRPGLSSAASLMTTLLISFDQVVLNQHLNLVTPEYPFFESPCAIALEILAERHQDIDAAIIAAFGDPGLFGARELFDIPIVGMAEAAMLTACMLGRRFSIVTFARALGPWYQECVEMHGLQDRCASIRMLEGQFQSIAEVQEEKEALLVDLASRAVKEDEADVIILGGAPLAGLADKVKDRIPVPLVDQIGAAVKQAEALVTLSTRKATAGTFRRPDPKPTVGLAEALASRIEHRAEPFNVGFRKGSRDCS